MARDAEIPINDPELDAILNEISAESDSAFEAPAAVAPSVLDAEDAASTCNEDVPTAPPAVEIPPEARVSGRVTVEQKVEAIIAASTEAEPEPSNFVVPEKVAALTDPLPWEGDAPVAAAPAAPEPTTEPPAEPAPAQSPTPRPPMLHHSIDPEDFKASTALSDTRIDAAFMDQNSLRAHYGAVSRHAEAQASRVKLQAEVKEAQLYDKHRKLLAMTGEKVTEKAVENAVKLDPIWIKIKNRVIEAETIAAINKELVESLKDRRDMLIQMGADRREEGKGSMRVMEALRDRQH